MESGLRADYSVTNSISDAEYTISLVAVRCTAVGASTMFALPLYISALNNSSGGIRTTGIIIRGDGIAESTKNTLEAPIAVLRRERDRKIIL